VRSLLRQAGIPEAFLGRMADIILMKPLLKSEMVQVARRMLDEQMKEFHERGIDVRYTDSFVNDVAATFFTQDQGARSVRNLIEHRVKSSVTQLVIKAQGVPHVKGKTIMLSLKDNRKSRTYIKASDASREVLLIADLINGQHKEQSVTLDATEFASHINLQAKQEVLRTSYHEAGHAIVNNPNLTGQKIALITVVGQDQYLGYARYEEISGKGKSSTESAVTAELARLFAGGLAEKMAGFEQSEGWQNDLEKARKLAGRYILDSGLGEGMASVPLDDKGRPRLSGQKAVQFQKEMDRLFKAGVDLANQSLKSNWSFIRAVVSELFYRGQITGQRFEQLQSTMKGRYLDVWQKDSSAKRITRLRCDALFH
jgi:hypothetical protein